MGKRSEMSTNYLAPPADPLGAVFSKEALSALKQHGNPSESLRYRLEVLEACGPALGNAKQQRRLRFLRAQKAAWETYLYSSFACRLFEGAEGCELRARLTSGDDTNFRSAIAECMACWFLGGRLQLPLKPKPPGKGKKILELLVEHTDGDMNIEVKAPFRPRLEGVASVDDSDILAQKLADANKQFPKGRRNVLFLAPQLTVRVASFRDFLIKAFIATEKIVVPINTQTGGPAGPITTQYSLEGKFTKGIKPDRSPGFTRVGAVACVEENFEEAWTPSGEHKVWMGHDVLVVHNPHAKHPIPQEIFGQYPQFTRVGESMAWTDGHPVSS